MANPKVVLAFSGGLDTSYCVVWLKEQGFEVHTYYVDTAGPGAAEAAPEAVEARALELGAASHRSIDAAGRLWSEIVTPLVMAGEWRQGRYPLLCSDRYLIVKMGVELAAELAAEAIAHGCTGMGNDQVRFDRSLRALGAAKIIAPIRAVPANAGNVRAYEQSYLEERGFEVPAKQKSYTINQNLLGATFSGGEIDDWRRPGDGARSLTRGPADWPREPLRRTVRFEKGEAAGLDTGEAGPALLARLNADFGAYGVGYGTYTGDTTVGLKGRIVFEAPGLVALETAHRALEHAVFTAEQNAFKPVAARKWSDLAYDGGYFDPLRQNVEDFLRATQERVSGEVVLETSGGSVDAVEIRSPNILTREGATYAQVSDWTAEEAEGFIKLSGQSAALWASVGGKTL
ncbi:MAG: argininosuccinate synthase [Pseudomonadota bacterium]